MYLVARPKAQADKLLGLFSRNGITAEYLPLVEIIYDAVELELALEQINQCASVLFLSPSSIDGLGARLAQLDPKLNLITSGLSSAELLMEYVPQAKIIYPEHGSGVANLILESKLANLGKIALVGGDNLNPRLAKYLEQKKVTYQFINLYQRINCGLANLAATERLILNHTLRGIVITSCQIAGFLLECAAQSPLVSARLQELKLITIHPQISLFLAEHQLQNVVETASAGNLAILNIIRGLEHERN
jgi:uroporphyrinogen-III synthase